MICRSTLTFPSQTPTELNQTINLSSDQFDVDPLLQENILSMVTLVPSLLTVQIAHTQEPPRYCREKNAPLIRHPIHTLLGGEPTVIVGFCVYQIP